MARPLFSVIVPSYKMGAYIAEALASVGCQTCPDWEIIVVDDAGPEDGTREAVTDFATRFASHRVEYIRHQKNGGVSAARNTAVRQAKGEYLAFLDPDDFWLPEKLEKQLTVLQSDETAVLCYTKARILRSGSGSAYAPSVDQLGNEPAATSEAAILGIATGQVFFALSSLILRKDTFVKAGGFLESLPFQNEDRIVIGCACYFGRMLWVPEPLCVYRIHDGSATMSVIRQRTAEVVEFDLATRIAVWLSTQSGGKAMGKRVISKVIRRRFRELLKNPVVLQYKSLTFHSLLALVMRYRFYVSILLVPPLRKSLGRSRAA